MPSGCACRRIEAASGRLVAFRARGFYLEKVPAAKSKTE